MAYSSYTVYIEQIYHLLQSVVTDVNYIDNIISKYFEFLGIIWKYFLIFYTIPKYNSDQ